MQMKNKIVGRNSTSFENQIEVAKTKPVIFDPYSLVIILIVEFLHM